MKHNNHASMWAARKLQSNALAARLTMCVLFSSPMFVYMLKVGLWQKHNNTPEPRGEVGRQLFCEMKYATTESFFCQPACGVSAFIYLLTPVVMMWQWHQLPSLSTTDKDKNNWFAAKSAEAILLGAVMVYLGIGNLAMHGFCASDGHTLDYTSMNMIVGLFLAHAFTVLLNDICLSIATCRRQHVHTNTAAGAAAAASPAEGPGASSGTSSTTTSNNSSPLLAPDDITAKPPSATSNTDPNSTAAAAATLHNTYLLRGRRPRVIFWFGFVFLTWFTWAGPHVCADCGDLPGDMMLIDVGLAIGIYILDALLFRRRSRPFLAWGVGTVFSLALGYTLWSALGQDDSPSCEPYSFFQWHAVWHFMTGVAVHCGWYMLRADPFYTRENGHIISGGESDDIDIENENSRTSTHRKIILHGKIENQITKQQTQQIKAYNAIVRV